MALVRGLLGIGLVPAAGNRIQFPAGVFNTTNFIFQALNPFVVFILYSYAFLQYVIHCIHRTKLVKCQCLHFAKNYRYFPYLSTRNIGPLTIYNKLHVGHAVLTQLQWCSSHYSTPGALT